MAVRGQLGERLVSDVIREIANQGLSGLLRLSQGETMKAIFFEEGAPVFAISNLPAEQLEYRLVKERRTTTGLLEAAKQRKGGQQLGRSLVEMGILPVKLMQQAASEIATQIILSLFEWRQGEYVFNETLSAMHDAPLDWSAADCILTGARHAAAVPGFLDLVAPPERRVIQADLSQNPLASLANLNSVEGYVFSRVESTTPISDIGTITGLPDEVTRPAVFVLLAIGLLE